MKTKQLIEILSKLNSETEIYLATDEEGNGHNKLYRCDFGWYTNYDFFPEKYTAKDNNQTKEEHNEMKKQPKVVCLIPF